MGKSKLSIQPPAHHVITLNAAGGASDSLFRGQVLLANIPPQCGVRVTLERVGRLRRVKETENAAASKALLRELGFMGPQKKVQKQERFDYETAEKLSGCLIRPSQGPTAYKTVKCDFDLPIPSYLPATAALPSVDISYAVCARCVLPNGRTLQASQDLRILRENAEPMHLEPSRTVAFPETSFAVRASFDSPDMSTEGTTIPTTLQLKGLNLPLNESMRTTETRWLVPREIRWELEETAIVITGLPDATGHIPMSTAQRTLERRKLANGKQKLKLRYPFTRSGNTPINMLPDDAGMEFPFNVTVRKDVSLGESTALSVAGGHIMHTVLSCDMPLNTTLPQKRFAVFLEYKLHIWLRIGEDVFDEASGDLVNRKVDEMAYTVVCPLTTQQNGQSATMGQDEEPTPVILPVYDGVWEQPPPEYTTYS